MRHGEALSENKTFNLERALTPLSKLLILLPAVQNFDCKQHGSKLRLSDSADSFV